MGEGEGGAISRAVSDDSAVSWALSKVGVLSWALRKYRFVSLALIEDSSVFYVLLIAHPCIIL